MNHAIGIHTGLGSDFAIRRKDGTLLEFDVSGLSTVQDVIDLINNHVDNQVPATRVTAQLADVGNGIELVTSDSSNTATLAVLKRNFSQAAEDLGLIPVGADESDPAVSGGGVDRITGRDVNPLEVAGIFNSLLRLGQALRDNDIVEISRTLAQLDLSADDLNFSRTEIGARQQGLDVLQTRIETDEIELKSALSLEIDADLAEAITAFTAAQVALTASLQTMATITRLTLLDFL